MLETDTARLNTTWLDSEVAARIIHVNIQIGYWASKGVGSLLRGTSKVALKTSDLEPGKVYVLASNHQSRIDPFMVCGQMQIATWETLGDFRYFTHNVLLNIPLLGSFLRGLGCFPSKPDPKYPSGLDYAAQQLAKGRSIYIFPEGRRTIRGEHPARRGVSELAKLPGAMIIPAHIEWHRKGWWNGFDAGIGKPFDGSKMTPQEILDRIYAVPVK